MKTEESVSNLSQEEMMARTLVRVLVALLLIGITWRLDAWWFMSWFYDLPALVVLLVLVLAPGLFILNVLFLAIAAEMLKRSPRPPA